MDPLPIFKRDIGELCTAQSKNPLEFFRGLVLEIVSSVSKSTDDLIKERYQNSNDPYMGKPDLVDSLRQSPSTELKHAMAWLKIQPHPNYCCPQLFHVPVLHQFRGTLCGFHALFNAKCMARALITDNRHT
jgi:hypothetical protein